MHRSARLLISSGYELSSADDGVNRRGAEHAALGASCRGGATANPNSLGSACEEVQYPVAECCTQAQSD